MKVEVETRGRRTVGATAVGGAAGAGWRRRDAGSSPHSIRTRSRPGGAGGRGGDGGGRVRGLVGATSGSKVQNRNSTVTII